QPKEVRPDPLGRVRCPACDDVCRQVTHLRDHLLRRHPSLYMRKERGGAVWVASRAHAEYPCLTCGKRYGTIASLRLHERKTHMATRAALVPRTTIRDPLKAVLRSL